MGIVGLVLDSVRPRVARPLLTIGVSGTDWAETGFADNAICEPVTQTVMIRPYCLLPGWGEGAAGNYVRLTRDDYVEADGSDVLAEDWAENNRRFAGDIYLESLDVDSPIYTRESFGANRGFYLSWYIPQTTDVAKVALEFGWGTILDEGTISVRVYAGGQAEVWQTFEGGGFANTRKVGDYSISGAAINLRKGNATKDAPKGDIVGRLINLIAIPCRRRELLVFSSTGGGFSHVFDELDPDVVNTITPAGQFWWKTPASKSSVQCAPLRFPTSGSVISELQTLREALPEGTTLTGRVYFDPPGGGATPGSETVTPSLRNADNTTVVWTPDGDSVELYVQADLTGDGNYTPFLYATFYRAPPLIKKTANAAQRTGGATNSGGFDISADVRSIRLSVGESSDSVSLTASLRRQIGQDVPLTAIKTRNNRPVNFTVDGAGAFWGVNREPTIDANRAVEWGEYITLEARDLWAQLEAAVYLEEPTPLDGEFLHTAVGTLLDHAGIPSGERDIEISGVRLPFTTAASQDEWSYRAKIGESVADVLKRIHDDFAATWIMGFAPGPDGDAPVFVFKSQDEMAAGNGGAPHATIYADREGDPDKTACRKFKQKTLAPEATRISVIGYDVRRNTLIRSAVTFAELENPEDVSAVGAVGEVRPYGLIEPRLTTEESVAAATDNLSYFLTQEVKLAEWECALLKRSDGAALYKGEIVRIHPYGDYQVLSYSTQITNQGEGVSESAGRATSYVGKWEADIPEGDD